MLRLRGCLVLLMLAAMLPASWPAHAQGQTPDQFEPNDTPGKVLTQGGDRSFLLAGQTSPELGFHIAASSEQGDVDWFYIFLKVGAWYRVRTTGRPGVDTELFLFDDPPPEGNASRERLLANNDDVAPGFRDSELVFLAGRTGRYWVKAWNRNPSPRTPDATYTVRLDEIAPPTPTPLPPSRTPFPGSPDKQEPNDTPANAFNIILDASYGANFMPLAAQSEADVDTDYYLLNVLPNQAYTCETFDLQNGADTLMLILNRERAGIATNDDADPANGVVGSKITFRLNYAGVAYIVISQADTPRVSLSRERGYSLRCVAGESIASGTATAVSKATAVATVTATVTAAVKPIAATQAPLATLPVATETPVAFPTAGRSPRNLGWRPLNEPGLPVIQPTSTPEPAAKVLAAAVFLDVNGNGRPDPNEGINDVPVRIEDADTGEVIDTLRTDANGLAGVAIFRDARLRIVLPTFGSVVINSAQNNISLQVAARMGDAVLVRWP